MSDVPTGEFFDAEKYQNPQQDWVCGHHAEGDPCPIGPNGTGECLVAKICVPVHNGSTWHCTRAKVWGGKCNDGPVPDADCPDQKAICPHQPAPCQPERSLRSKRRLVTGLIAAGTLGCCLLVLGGSSGSPDRVVGASSAAISPGPLSAHHATLDQSCAACHSAASASPVEMLNCAFGANDGIQESQKCLECHTDLGNQAMFPHSLNPVDLAARTEQSRQSNPSASHTTQQRLARMLATHETTELGELGCSVCHREHRGAAHDLTHLTNAQCQSCHSSTFHSFTDGHSEFPERDRAYINFDHVTHLGTHFPNHGDPDGQESNALKCTDCHVQDATGNLMILDRFENICATCHSGQITDDHMPPDLRLPGTPFISLNLAGILKNVSNDASEEGQPETEIPVNKNDDWPSPAADQRKPPRDNRFDDLPPFMEVMLVSDAAGRAALGTLRSGGNPDSQISTDDLASARESYAQSIRRLIDDLVAYREQAVTARLQAVPNAEGVTIGNAAVVSQRLADSGFFSALEIARNVWFPNSNMDADAAEPASEGTSPAIPKLSSTGAWEVSDRLVLSYRCTGHGDPLLRDWISFAAATATQYPDPPESGLTGAFDRLFRLLVAPEATGHCMKCHTVDEPRPGPLHSERLHVNWNSRQVLSARREFTKFAHGPHVTLLSNEQQEKEKDGSPKTVCQKCHGLMEHDSVPQKSAFHRDDWMPDPNYAQPSTIGVSSVTRASCVECHTPKLAGDNCLQCHNYHVSPTFAGEH